MTVRLTGTGPGASAERAGERVVLDLRPLQEPERTPITAGYLRRLLEAFAAAPVPDESFVMVLRALREDPSRALEAHGLPVVGRRHIPSTRVLRSAGLTLDSFLLRAAEVRAGARGTGGDGRGRHGVYHTAGGAVPLGSRLPVVATLLDLAPWELPETYAHSPAARFGHRLRARVLHDAARLIVPSRATAESARRRFHVDPSRIAVVPLAPDDAFDPGAGLPGRLAGVRGRLGLPERYLVFAGRYDARKDLVTLFEALGALRDEAAGRSVEPAGPAYAREGGRDLDAVEPPRIVFVGAGAGAEDASDASAMARAAARQGLDELIVLTTRLDADDLATLVAGARAFVYPALSEGTGQGVMEALATGVPVIASAVGPLPELVGGAGIIVEPRDPERLAAALRAVWWNDALQAQLARTAAARARERRRTWADVARETRAVYADATAAPVPPIAPPRD